MKFRNLRADEIELRIGQVVKGKGVTLLCYQNARCGMDILDETVGVEYWQREHYEVKGNMFCRVGIRINPPAGEPYWLWKSDCGTESDTERQKGEASDSFKRALVNWGIGRELYTSPFIWISLSEYNFDENGKVSKDTQRLINGFRVKEVDYSNNTMTKLIIVDKDGTVVFSWAMKSEPTKVDKNAIEALKAKCESAGVKEEVILEHYKVKSFSDLTVDQWTGAMKKLDANKKASENK